MAGLFNLGVEYSFKVLSVMSYNVFQQVDALEDIIQSTLASQL